jgi:hypothetical protein
MIVPTQLSEEATRRSAVTFAHYARAVQYTECAIYGVDDGSGSGTVGNECRDIWTLDQRNYIMRYLEEAQIELENETKNLFGSTWVTGDLNAPTERLTDVKAYKRRKHYHNFCDGPAIYTRWNNVKAVGRLVPVEVDTGVAVSHVTDPATIAVVIDPAVVTDVHKVRIFEAGNYGTDKEIALDASAISISGVNMAIEIPRCRMVDYDLRDNPVAGLDYADTSNFIDEVDIYYYTTVNTDSLVVTKSNCDCATSEETGCLEIVTTGITTVKAASACEICPCSCNCDDIYAGFYYEAGDSIVNQNVIDMIIRLAHAKMPIEPCGCEIAQRLWKQDRDIPGFITIERARCPFGLNNGAWIAWKWSQALNKKRLGFI